MWGEGGVVGRGKGGNKKGKDKKEREGDVKEREGGRGV